MRLVNAKSPTDTKYHANRCSRHQESRTLVNTVKRNVTIDWTVKDSVRTKLRVIVKCILRKHGCPPDKQEAATNTVMQQAEMLSDVWVGSR